MRILLFIRDVAITYVLTVLALSLVYLVIPPASTVMLASALTGHGMAREWVPMERISPDVIRSVIVSEDARFCDHHGIDWKAVDKAVAGGGRRGASTITMQVAKNLFLWNGRSWFRKALEAPIALWIDLVWPKTRILEVYLNIAQWGDGVFGIEEAARRNFGVGARGVNNWQAAVLATTLPDPVRRRAARPGPSHIGMAETAAARAYSANTACIRR